MGSFFTKHKKTKSRITEQDKAVLQLKHQRDRIKQYQKRLEFSMENDRQLARKCLANGRKERAKLLLRKKKFQENLLLNTDKQLENLEKLAADIEYAQVEVEVLAGLKRGNEALKQMHALLDINEIEKIMEETHEGIEKQNEINSLLNEVWSEQDEDDVLAELDALANEKQENELKLPDVPQDNLPTQLDDTVREQPATNAKVKTQQILIEA